MVAEDLQSPLNSTDRDINDDKYIYEGDDDDAEETLSLCDLPIYSDSFKWDDDLSSRDQSSSSFENDDDDNDCFEFFSDDLTPSTNPNGDDKTEIVFCGKLIPYKGTTTQYDNIIAPKLKHNTAVNSIFQYLKPSNDSKPMSSRRDQGFRFGKVAKVSVLASPAPATAKRRWYLYLFGMVRFPAVEMELRDIRKRQSRRRRRTGSKSPSFGDDKVGETTKKKVSSDSKRSGVKALWGLLRALGCRSRHVANMAKAAYGAAPLVSGA